MANRARMASIIIVDTGPATAKRLPNGSTFLEQSKKTVTSILQRKIFSESKDEFGLILFGTDHTDNKLSSDDGNEYWNVVEARNLGEVNWTLMDVVKKIEQGNVGGDFLDAIVVALDCFNRDTRKVTGRRMVLITNFGSSFSKDNFDQIVTGMKSMNVNMTVIGTDLLENIGDDTFKIKVETGDQTKSNQQRSGEMVARKMLMQIDGSSFSFSEVEPALKHFERRSVRPCPWKVNLEIGGDLAIPVVLYLQLSKFTIKSRKQCYARDKTARVMLERSFHKSDEAQTECAKDDLIEAYRYGSTLVPFSAEDKANMAYQSDRKCFSLLAFCKQERIKRHHFLGTSVHRVYPDPIDESSNRCLSAFIHALYETGTVAIMRYCYSARSSPKIGFMSPIIQADLQCLTFIQLPYSEDLRLFSFPSLDANPKNKPTDEQLSAVDELITAMDLTKEGTEKEPIELLQPEYMLNPNIQHSYKCMLHRGLNPNAPLPKVDPEIAVTFAPLKEITEASESAAKKIKLLFPLTRVEHKKKDKTGATVFEDKKVKDEPASQDAGRCMPDGIDALTRDAIMEVGTVTPRQDFEAIIGRDVSELENACQQLQKVILKLVVDTFAGIRRDEYHSKALDGLAALRSESVKDRAIQFNDYMIKFKESLCGSGKLDFWEQIVEKKIGLIGEDEAPHSGSSLEARDAFFKIDIKTSASAPSPPPAEDADDLLDMM